MLVNEFREINNIMEKLQFSHSKLVLEFFVREFSFNGKGILRTQLPKDAFFYTGLSKAKEYRYLERVHNRYVIRTQEKPQLVIKPDALLFSSEIDPALFAKINKTTTNTIIKIGGDYLCECDGQYNWYFSPNKIKTNIYSGNNATLNYSNVRSLAPYQFNIEEVKSNGTIVTNFPRESISLSIVAGETARFICRREEYSFGDDYEPSLNLVMWVKNHGFYSDYQLIRDSLLETESVIEPFYIQPAREFDFRKSKLRFELG